MPLTMEERVKRASAARVVSARRRRFDRFAAEMADHPQELEQTAQNKLAEALTDCGWVVHVPA